MKTDAQDIDMLARAILTEARDEAEQIKAEAQEKADAIRKRAQEQAEAERKAILDRARTDVERLRGQSRATAQLNARSQQLGFREDLLNRVFDAVRQKLVDVQKRSDYDEIATMLLREALSELGVSKASVRADAATLAFLNRSGLSDLSKELNGEFTAGEALEDGNGIVVNAADGKLHYDNTFETRLDRLQNSLRAAVYNVLIGEK